MPQHWYPDRANATLQRRATADELEAQIKGYIRSRADQLAQHSGMTVAGCAVSAIATDW